MRLVAALAVVIPLGLGATLPVPADNPLTPENISLGQRLFDDRRLSRDGTIACSSCHDPERAFTKPDAVSPGVFGRRGRRNAPTVLNRAWGRVFFWDGRSPTLEDQVLKPIQDPNEMDLSIEEASRRVGVAPADMARALASYIRSLMAGNSPYDRFTNGERTALSADERNGLRVFQGRGNCIICHEGANLTDEKLHNTGVAWLPADERAGTPGRFTDEGGLAITGTARDRGAFKTPTLRDVGKTAPYMHDGSMATLDEVVDFYDRGGRQNPALDPDMEQLDLSVEDKRALVAFLKTALLSAPPAAR